MSETPGQLAALCSQLSGLDLSNPEAKFHAKMTTRANALSRVVRAAEAVDAQHFDGQRFIGDLCWNEDPEPLLAELRSALADLKALK